MSAGYGNIAPKTALGRFVTIPYAVVGIPLTLLTIAHLGGFLATVFRFIYKNIAYRLKCCEGATWRRDDQLKSHEMTDACYVTDQPQQPQQPQLVVHDIGDYSIATSPHDVTKYPLQNETTAIQASLVQRFFNPNTARSAVMAVSGRVALDKMRRSYRGIVEWRRGLTNALYTEDNQQVRVPLYVSLLLISGYVSLGAVMFGLWESEWDFLIGSYFCFITLSTIGFGDFVPGTSLDDWSSQQKLVLCSLYLICGLALLAMCFDLMQEEARKKFRQCGRWLGLLENQPTVDTAFRD